MKTFKKTIAIVLALCMIFGSCVSVFAHDSIFDFFPKRNEINYVAFGDSITRGYGANENWENVVYGMDSKDDSNCRNVEGSYPYNLALKLGLDPDNDITKKDEHYWPIAQDAVTTSYLLDLFGIDDHYCDKEFLWEYMDSRYNTLLYYFGAKESFNLDNATRYGQIGIVKSIKELVSTSTLITIDVGMGDVLNRSRQLAQNVLPEDFSFSSVSSEPLVIVKAVATLVAEMYKGYERFEKNFPLILNYFKRYAPKSTVVIVGAINPVFNMPLSSEYLIPVGTALSVITEKMNRQYEKWAKQYGYIYVDVANVETGETEGNDGIGVIEFLGLLNEPHVQGELIHPTPRGYEQMSDAIFDAIAGEKGFSLKTTIKLDTGRLDAENLKSVKVDGIERFHYVKDGKLCIPCLTKLAQTLTITAENDGKTQLTFYDLTYKDGYVAKRLYTTNSTEAVKESISGMINSIKDLIAGDK